MPLGKFLGSYLQAAKFLNTTFNAIPNTYFVRKVKASDSYLVKCFIQKVLIQRGGVGIDKLYYDKDLADIHQAYNKENCHFWVLTKKGDIKGTLGMEMIGRKACLTKFYVDHDSMDHGLSLIKMAQSAAKRAKLEELSVVIDSNDSKITEMLRATSFSLSTSGGEGLDVYVQTVI